MTWYVNDWGPANPEADQRAAEFERRRKEQSMETPELTPEEESDAGAAADSIMEQVNTNRLAGSSVPQHVTIAFYEFIAQACAEHIAVIREEMAGRDEDPNHA